MKSCRIIIRYLKRADGRYVLLKASLVGCLLILLSFGNPGRIDAGEALAGNTDPGRPAIRIEELEKRIHELVNKERKKEGLDVLDWNSQLSMIARGHSRDMSSRNYFSHVSPEGRDCEHRYNQQGFSCRIATGGGRYTVGGENIFQNNLYNSVTYIKSAGSLRTVYEWSNLEQIAQSTVAGWMKKPGHRKNILWPYWKTEGIGVAISPDGRVLITQNFC
jgi:uncharacterized protein YkwD